MTRPFTTRITEPQRQALAEEAKRLGISIGELLRRVLDEARKGWGKR